MGAEEGDLDREAGADRHEDQRPGRQRQPGKHGGDYMRVPRARLLVSAFPLWILGSTSYTLTSSHLLVRSGPFRWLIPLDSIQSIMPTRDPLSSPALSIDRLRIESVPERAEREARRFTPSLNPGCLSAPHVRHARGHRAAVRHHSRHARLLDGKRPPGRRARRHSAVKHASPRRFRTARCRSAHRHAARSTRRRAAWSHACSTERCFPPAR
jgi:hypothetical protein